MRISRELVIREMNGGRIVFGPPISLLRNPPERKLIHLHDEENSTSSLDAILREEFKKSAQKWNNQCDYLQ